MAADKAGKQALSQLRVHDLPRWGLRRLSLLRDTALATLFPAECAFCQRGLDQSGYAPRLCHDCRDELLVPGAVLCPTCGAFTKVRDRDGKCGECRTARFRFDRVIALGPYRGALRQAILRMKHCGQDPLAAALGKLLAHRATEAFSNERFVPLDVLVNAPMYWRRRLTRGVNNAEVIAEQTARAMGCLWQPKLLVSCRNTKKQSTLPLAQRRRNLRGAYRVPAGYDIRGAHVGFVDDILTTGATATEATRVLLGAGAAQVTVLVAARAAGNRPSETHTGLSPVQGVRNRKE